MQYPDFPEGPCAIYRDGVHVEDCETGNDAFVRLLAIQSQSVLWALRYEGWSVNAR